MATIDITDVIAQTLDYARKHSKQIYAMVFQGIELENYMTGISGVSDEHVGTNASIGEVLQPFHKSFQPKGEAKFTPVTTKVRQIKVDFLLDEFDKVYRTYLAFLADEEKTYKEWPLVKYIIYKLLVPRMIEDLNMASAKGSYVANTGGVAKPAIDSVDGILTTVTNLVTASSLVPIATGPLVASTMVDQVEAFMKTIPNKFVKAGKTMPLLMSTSNARKYGADYISSYGPHNDYKGEGNSVTNKYPIIGFSNPVIGLDSLEGSDRFVCTPKWNMLKCYDKINIPKKFDVQPFDRTLKLMTDFKRGYGFEATEMLFVNDQA